MKYLLDTNVVSELRKGTGCQGSVREWFDGVRADQIYLSCLVTGEIRKGIELLRRRDAQAAQALDLWFQELKLSQGHHILPVDELITELWAKLNVPNPLPVIDGLLAATALVHELTLVTRNTKDVAGTGVQVLNPFDD